MILGERFGRHRRWPPPRVLGGGEPSLARSALLYATGERRASTLPLPLLLAGLLAARSIAAEPADGGYEPGSPGPTSDQAAEPAEQAIDPRQHDGAGGEDADPWDEPPHSVRRWRPNWPALGLLPDVGELVCVVQVSIDPSGSVTDVQPEDCYPTLWIESEHAARKWVFQPATKDGLPIPSTMKLTFRYVNFAGDAFPVDKDYFNRLVAQHQQVGQPSTRCVMSLVVHPKGQLSGIESSDVPRCLVIPTGLVKPKASALNPDKELGCRVSFVSVRGDAQDLAFDDCSPNLMAPTRRLVESWVWNYYGPEPTPYTLTTWYTPVLVVN